MKRICLFTLLALFSVACAKHLQEMEESAATRGFTFKASIDNTKFSVNEMGKVYWDANDSIGIFVNGQVVKCLLEEGAGTSTGTFSCAMDIRGKNVGGAAVYPYRSNLTLSGKSVTVIIPSSNSEGTIIPIPLVGVRQSDDSYTFRNIAALFRVKYTNIPAIANSVRVTATTNISGTFTLPDYESSNLTQEASTSGGKVLWFYLPKRRPNNTAYVDFPMPAGTQSSLKVELVDVANNVLDTKNTNNKSFTAGVLKPMADINIPGDRINVEWVWNPGSLPTFRSNIPAIDNNGNVYVTSKDGTVYKVDNRGQMTWRAKVNGIAGNVETSPSIEPDGSAIYFAGGQDNDGRFVALNADGKVKWTFNDYCWTDVESKRNFWQSFIGVGSENLYLPVGTLCTILSVRKSDGARVCYGTGNLDGRRTGVDGAGAGCAIGLSGTVSYMSRSGAFSWKKSELDNPTLINQSYGKFAPWGYQDLYPQWGPVQYDKQGVIAAKKGPTFGKDVIISCIQESYGRIDVCCYPASFAIDYTLKRHDDNVLKYYWRHQIGNNTGGAADPAMQDQGGIVMGHENLVVIVPMKNRPGASNPNIGSGGLYTIWVGRTDDGGTTCWRVNVAENLSGAAAVDNNGNVHFATDKYYYIVKPNTANGGSYEILYKADIRNLLLASGKMGYFNYTGVWSSVKIAKGGKIYLNVNIDNSYGVTCCFTYPGVTGPDTTSSWPQKGADQYNSCNQQL